VSKKLCDWGIGKRNSSKPSFFSVSNGAAWVQSGAGARFLLFMATGLIDDMFRLVQCRSIFDMVRFSRSSCFRFMIILLLSDQKGKSSYHKRYYALVWAE
jgi:hypothetical protein